MTDFEKALIAYDAFMSGAEITHEQEALARRVAVAGCFGAEAYERGIDANQGTHAMARSFLIALIDPSGTDLDYLRASAAGCDAV